MKITSLELWRDPGFTDGSVEVPALTGSSLPDPDFSLPAEGSTLSLIPSKDDIFRTIKLAKEYSKLYNMNYLKAVFETGDEETLTFYGWIDTVLISSDTPDYPVTVINWHIDLWRTFAAQAEFGYGLVTRRIRAESDPIQNVPARYHTVSDRVENLVPDDIVGGGCYWAVINYTFEDADTHATETRVIVCPVAKTPNTVYYMKLSADSTARRVPTLNQWILGEYDEIFGLAPSSIVSVFLSPIPPLKLYSGTGTLADPFVVVGSSVAPEPRIETYAGKDKVNVASMGTNEIYLTNGSSVRLASWNSARINTARGVSKSGSGYSNTLNAIVTQGETVLLTSAGSNDAPGPSLSALSVDDYMRDVLGETVFNNLANGDSVVFSDIYGLYVSGNIEQELRTVSLPTSSMNIATWKASVGSTVTSDTRLYFNNGTFGSYWVVVNGVVSTSSVELTTYTEATTTADYGVVERTVDDVIYMYLYTKTNRFEEYTAELSSPVKTTDTERFVVTDQDGAVVGSIPWGLTVQSYTYRCVISASAGYVQFRFDGLNSSAEGLQFTIPLPTLDITSNSWSDYVYSGQRDYDIEQRRIARESALVEGLGGAISGGAQGAMLGALKGNRDLAPYTYGGKPYREIAGMAGLGFLGATASIAGSLINYASAGYYNEKLQSASDMLQARQLDSITTPGNGCDWLYYGRPYQIRSIVPDDYSLERFESDVSLNGISVSEPTADCTALIHGTGPLAIENLIVRGNIPAEAKQYIKTRLNKGVRLV